MAQQLYLDRGKFIRAMTAKGYGSVREFIEAAGIHRNSIAQYLSQEKGVFADLFERICFQLGVADPLTLLTSEVERSGVLSEVRLRSVLEPVAANSPSIAFVLIGSRATGRAQENSDWDIGITAGPQHLSTEAYLKVKSEIADLTDDFAQSCDVVNLDAAPIWFLKEMNYVPAFLVGNRGSYIYLQGMIDGFRKAREDHKSTRAA